jgi:general L-amino acid transport system permease protein
MALGDSVALTNRGFYVPEPLFSRSLGDIHLLGDHAFRFDVSLDLVVILAVLIAGILTAGLIGRRADRIQAATGDRPHTLSYRIGVIVVPMALLLTILGLYFGYPELKGFNFAGGTYLRNSLIALWIALSLYTAAFIAEIVRAGILAISKGQTEAAAALGIRPRKVMSLVILPQALRVIIPPLISQYLNLTKNSSLAIAVGYMDVTGTLMGITMNQTGRELETVLATMLIYLTISLTISFVMNIYNNAVKLKER